MNIVTRALAGAGAAGVLAAAGLASAIPAASAATPVTAAPAQGQPALTRVQTAAHAQIARRLTALETALTAVQANRFLTAGDKAALTAILSQDVTGLTALRQTIDADTTVEQASSDYRTIFVTYRVYALALPQVRYAAAGDAISGEVVPLLTEAQSRLTAALAADPTKNTAAVQASMSDLAGQISTASAKTAGLATTVLALTPAQYNADPGLLAPSRQDLAEARAAIATARADIASVQAALR